MFQDMRPRTVNCYDVDHYVLMCFHVIISDRLKKIIPYVSLKVL